MKALKELGTARTLLRAAAVSLIALSATTGAGLGLLATATGTHAQGMVTVGNAGTSQRISLGLNKSIVIDLPRDAYDILVANPGVADAVTRTARRIYLFGKRNRGLNSAFTLRKISHGVGVERTFQTYSPLLDSITVKRRGDVRQAKLYYLRERSGKAARIKEKLSN